MVALNRPAGLQFAYQHSAFLLGLSASIPLTLVVTLGLRLACGAGRDRLVWIKQPTVAVRLEPAGTIAEAREVVRRRLTGTGFAVKEQTGAGGETLLDFAKPKKPRIHSFIDHAFRGTISLRSATHRLEADVSLTFDDLVLVETGEYGRLHALAGFLAGANADYVVKQAPLTLVTGTTLAMANLAALAFGLVTHAAWISSTFSVSFAAAALCVWGTAVVLQDRRNLEGLGLGVLGLGAASVPFLTLM